MRLWLLASNLLTAAALVSAAHADTTNFQITGTNTTTNTPYTISFSLDPAAATPESNDFSFFNVAATIDSVPDTVIVTFAPDNIGNRLYIQEPDYGTFFESDLFKPNGLTQFFSGSGLQNSAPTFNDGTYAGNNYISCQNDDLAVATPHALFPTAALLQLPVITTGCGEAVTLTERTPAVGPTGPTVTPEPSTLALLGTGVLSIAGVVRRRYTL